MQRIISGLAFAIKNDAFANEKTLLKGALRDQRIQLEAEKSGYKAQVTKKQQKTLTRLTKVEAMLVDCKKHKTEFDHLKPIIKRLD